MNQFDLSGRVAIVTGGNGGIGLGMAQGLADAGAAIVVAARNREKSASGVAALAALGVQSAFIAARCRRCRHPAGRGRRSVERFGRLDILVNNAGMSIRKPPETYDLEEWQSVLDINLTGAFVCCQAAHAAMKRPGRRQDHQYRLDDLDLRRRLCGGLRGEQGRHRAADQIARHRLGGDNIQVNAVLPGWIDTELTRDARRQVPGLHERILRRTPAGRWGRPRISPGIAVFLASPGIRFRHRRGDPGRRRLRRRILALSHRAES